MTAGTGGSPAPGARAGDRDGGPPVTYLDHAATSPMRPEVAEAVAPFAAGRYGNASGSHRLAREARRSLEEARDEIAELLGCSPSEVVLTSGGTEADNLAVKGVLGACTGAPGTPVAVVCTAVEHSAVLEPCRAVSRAVGRHGGPPVMVREAPVDADGAVDPDRLEGLLDPGVSLVSVMLANNEVGTVQPLDRVAPVVRRAAPSAVLHTDAVQAAAWLDLRVHAAAADLVSVSAHKLGGPRGAGALVVRRGTPLAPLLHGGGQEQERRSGTHDVGGAVGLAAALRLVDAERAAEAARVGALRDRLADGLRSAVPGTVESADRRRLLPGHCHLRFAGVEQEELLLLLDEAGVCASAGAACASGALEPSHVLRAMGVPTGEARTAVRLTLGWTTAGDDVDRALAAVPAAVARLRG